MMTAYDLRRHLHIAHGVNMTGADYHALLNVHDVKHWDGAGHQHEEGPGSPQWVAECAEFGCHEERTDGP